MANKSFVVQYLIKAREQYSAAAEKVRRSSEGMRKSIDRTKKALVLSSAKAVTLKNRTKALIPAFNALSITAATTRNRLETVGPSMSRLGRDADRLKQKLKGVRDRFEGVSRVGRKMRNIGAGVTAFISAPVVLAANSMKNAARDAEETRSKFRQVFQGMEGEAERTADTFAKSFGLAGTTARDLLGDAGDLLIGIGLTRKEALATSLEMNRLSSDLASFKNFQGGAAAASSAMLRAMVGEREALKGLGIALTEEMVKRKMLELFRAGTAAKSKEQLKIMATMALITEKSKNAIGDFARTQEELANQERITTQRTIEMREAFGRVLMPAALLLTQTIRRVADALTALSPGVKKTILIVAALAAVLGPLLLVVGVLIMALPLLAAGFTILSAVAAPALGILVGGVYLLAAAATVVTRNWDRMKAFFSGFAKGFQASFGPAATAFVENFKEAASIIAGLFSKDSDAARSLFEFANIGQLIGEIIGGSLDLILRGLSGIGAIIGQVIGAITTLDFGQFDVEAIKAEFLGAKAEPLLTQTRVDVGVNVGLDKGLAQTGTASVAGAGTRRLDVGGVLQ